MGPLRRRCKLGHKEGCDEEGMFVEHQNPCFTIGVSAKIRSPASCSRPDNRDLARNCSSILLLLSSHRRVPLFALRFELTSIFRPLANTTEAYDEL